MSTSHGTPIPGSRRPSEGRTGTTSRSGRSPGQAEARASHRRDLLAIGGVLAAALALILGVLVGGCGGATATLHRSSIVSVKAVPWNQALSLHAQNTVIPDPELGFAVTVANPGRARERDIAVAVTVDGKTFRRTVDRLEAGERRTVVVRRPSWGAGRVTTLVVETQPAKGQRTLAAYPVAFEAVRPPVAGGLHGTGLEGVKALPGNRPLSPTRASSVVAPRSAGFAVSVKNTGDFPESRIRVTITLRQTPSPIIATKTIPFLDTGRRATVVFRGLRRLVYATRLRLQVDVQPVAGEHNLGNNSARYLVVFSL